MRYSHSLSFLYQREFVHLKIILNNLPKPRKIMMFFSIVLLLLVECAFWQKVSCFSLVEKVNFEANTKGQYYRRDGNSILEDVQKHDTRPKNSRSKRDLAVSLSSTESSIRVAYERTMNQTISDYYAQRKAVMKRYYARQRDILEKFRRKTTESPRFTKQPIKTTNQIFETTTETREMTIANTTPVAKIMDYDKNENAFPKSITPNEAEMNEREKNNSAVAWIYRTNNWNPRELGNETDIEFQSESSSSVARRVDSTSVDGYYKLGDFKGSEDEKVVYQHNLGLGLKGSSELDATFEVILEGPFAITAIEAFPYAHTRAKFSWIAGGPGTNSVKLRLMGYENEGFSYTVKVWGVPI